MSTCKYCGKEFDPTDPVKMTGCICANHHEDDSGNCLICDEVKKPPTQEAIESSKRITAVLDELLAKQERLPRDFEDVLYDNLDDLYERD